MFRYKATLSYIIFIVLVNTSYQYFPLLSIKGSPFSTGDMLIGAIYLFRDFAQREIKHYVIFAMLFGALISYMLADKTMAIASVCSFTVGETIDWGIFTFTKKPLSERLLWSSAISVPIDSAVFLAIYGPFNFIGISVLSTSKVSGVLLVWFYWRQRHKKLATAFG